MAGPEPEPSGSGRPASAYLPVARAVGTLVAPVTLLTALLLYHGLTYSTYYWRYFGLDPTLLEITTQDHLARSVDALFVPLLGLAAIVLALLAGHGIVDRLRARWGRRRAARAVVIVLLPFGVELVLLGAVSIVWPLRTVVHFLVPPTAFGLGVLLLAYAAHVAAPAGSTRGAGPVAAPTRVLQAAAVSALVVLALFWATADYAAEVGQARARADLAELRSGAGLVVHSDRRLLLSGPGVEEVRCEADDAAHPYRYRGLRLLVRSGERYVLLPQGWSRADGAAIVLPVGDVQRLDLTLGAATATSGPPC